MTEVAEQRVGTTPETLAVGDREGDAAVAPKRSPISYLRLHPRFAKALVLGILSGGLYVGLFANEQTVLSWSIGHSLSFLVPLTIAFVFSFVHGAFTGAFWDAIGIKPKPAKKT